MLAGGTDPNLGSHYFQQHARLEMRAHFEKVACGSNDYDDRGVQSELTAAGDSCWGLLRHPWPLDEDVS